MPSKPKETTRTEALELLKAGPSGIKTWNRLRAAGVSLPSLAGVVLSNTQFYTIDEGSNLGFVDLRGAVISGCRFYKANLENTDLSATVIVDTIIDASDICSATFSRSKLSDTMFLSSNLRDANFRGTHLAGVRIDDCDLLGADFTAATFTDVHVASCLVGAKGLETIVHRSGSSLDINRCMLTFKNDMPESFLRGCGLRDEEIAYFHAQIGKPIRFYECFISYSTADEKFANRLFNDFQGTGIRCWKWNEDAKTGKNLWGEIDRAIRKFDKLVLIASESSLRSPYVADEIERAIRKERELEAKRNQGEFSGETDVLFPVRLDDYILSGWEHERKVDVTKKVIADARGWEKDAMVYARVRDKLIKDLRK